MDPQAARERIIELARAEGFGLVRFARAELVEAARSTARERRVEGALADMAWMTDEWLCRATDPEAFLAGARTLIVLGVPYHGEEPGAPDDGVSRGRVARYARGRDYHRLFESKLRRMVRAMREELGAEARGTVDYGPLLERPYASLAGLGWLGKSTMLLVPGFGPWVLLGAIATSIEVEPDAPLRKTCGSCTRCIVACPTGAISPEGDVLDARLCISYHTIENRGPIPRELRASFGDWIFGCDDCLDACPVGAENHDTHPDLAPKSVEDARPELAGLLELDEEAFSERFRGRAIMRTKRDGLLRNVCVALGNVGTEADAAALTQALSDGSPLVRGHAAWALGRLAERFPGECARVEATLRRASGGERDAYVLEEIELASARIRG
jgi:epoxyqueuosine reductase